MKFMGYPIKVPTLPSTAQCLSTFLLTWEREQLRHIYCPILSREEKVGLWEHLLLAFWVPLLHFLFILIKHISTVMIQKEQLRKHPWLSEYEVVR